MTMQSTKNTKKLFIGIIIIMLAMLAGGWYYLQNLTPTFKIESDKNSYFTVDHPQIQIKLINQKEAETGKIVLSYDSRLLEIEEINSSEGVTSRELDNNLIFDLSKEYLASENEIIAKLKFKGTSEIGEAQFIIDPEKSSLTEAATKNIEIQIEDKTIEIGITPDRSENNVSNEKSF